jgi:hypothetical protein
MTEVALGQTPMPPDTDDAVARWMKGHGWDVAPARWQMEPEAGFFIWQEHTPQQGRAHALWVSETMIRRLKPVQLVDVLIQQHVAEEIRVSLQIRIEERGAEYRVSVVPRISGEFKAQE